MIVKVRMLAFHEAGRDPDFREVVIPDEPMTLLDKLAKVFHFGQNDFQPLPKCCSVSVGDVIFDGDDRYLVCARGFRKLTADEYAAFEKLDRRERSFQGYELLDNVHQD